MTLREELLKLKESGKNAISTPYDVSIFGDLTAKVLNFGKITCSENTMDYIVTAANSFDSLIDLAIEMAETLDFYADSANWRGMVHESPSPMLADTQNGHGAGYFASQVLAAAAEKVRGMNGMLR